MGHWHPWFWIKHQWGRAIWAFDHDGGTWVQGFAGAVSALTTIVLVFLTAYSLRQTRRALRVANRQAKETQRQTEQLRQQLLLMAHPNVAVAVEVDDKRRQVHVSFTNRGAYPVVITNPYLQQIVGDATLFRHRLHEVAGVTISSGSTSGTWDFFNSNADSEIDMEAGFSDFVEVEFECADTLGLIKKKCAYQNLFGFRALM